MFNPHGPNLGTQFHDRLIRRLARFGADSCDDDELLTLFLSQTLRMRNAIGPARLLIKRFGGLSEVLHASPEEIARVSGLTLEAASGLALIRAVCGRHLQRSAERNGTRLEPASLVDVWRCRIGALCHEVFEVGYLDSSYRLLVDGIERIEEGTVDRAAVYPRAVIVAALQREAFGIVLAHNHPNGRVEPSEHDQHITRAILLAAETVDLRVLDHVIVSRGGAFSFKAAGLL